MLYPRTANMGLFPLPSGCNCVRVCRMRSAVLAASFVIQSSLQRLCNHVNRTKTIPLESLIDFTGMMGLPWQTTLSQMPFDAATYIERVACLLSAHFPFFLSHFFQFLHGFIKGWLSVLVNHGAGVPGSVNCDCDFRALIVGYTSTQTPPLSASSQLNPFMIYKSHRVAPKYDKRAADADH